MPIVIVIEWACWDTAGSSGPWNLVAIAIGPDWLNSHPDAAKSEIKHKVVRAVWHAVDYLDELGTAHRVICKIIEVSIDMSN